MRIEQNRTDNTNNNDNNSAVPLFLVLFTPWHALFLCHLAALKVATSQRYQLFSFPLSAATDHALSPKCHLLSYLTYVCILVPPAPADFLRLYSTAPFASCRAFHIPLPSWLIRLLSLRLLGFTLRIYICLHFHFPFFVLRFSHKWAICFPFHFASCNIFIIISGFFAFALSDLLCLESHGVVRSVNSISRWLSIMRTSKRGLRHCLTPWDAYYKWYINKSYS